MSFCQIDDDEPHVRFDVTSWHNSRMIEILDWIHQTFDYEPRCRLAWEHLPATPSSRPEGRSILWLKVVLRPSDMVYLKLRWG